ncbi:hypothetical protein O9929_17270 [Vibrio lentus]|nr:hypothetical protein [Vibrio lentus]
MVLGGFGTTIRSHIDGYLIASELNHGTVSNPLNKQAMAETGAWLTNFRYLFLDVVCTDWRCAYSAISFY